MVGLSGLGIVLVTQEGFTLAYTDHCFSLMPVKSFATQHSLGELVNA